MILILAPQYHRLHLLIGVLFKQIQALVLQFKKYIRTQCTSMLFLLLLLLTLFTFHF